MVYGLISSREISSQVNCYGVWVNLIKAIIGQLFFLGFPIIVFWLDKKREDDDDEEEEEEDEHDVGHPFLPDGEDEDEEHQHDDDDLVWLIEQL